MTTLRFLLAPVLALFDLKIYREAANIRVGKSFLYLTYLSFVFTVILFFAGMANMPKADAFVGWLKSNFTGATLSREGMKLDVPGRIELRHPQWGPIAVFDDTRETIQPDEMGLFPVYVTSKMMYVRRNGSVQSSAIGSNAQKDFKTHIDSALIQKIYDRLKVPVASFLLFFTFVISLVWRIFLALLLASAGVGLQLILSRKLSFSALWNVASFALSIGFVFSLFELIPGLGRFFSGGVALVLSLIYLGIGIAVQPKN